MTDLTMKQAFSRYRKEVSILKRGLAQEKFRLAHLSKSFLGPMIAREVTSVDIATYRDQRLKELNPKTNKTISPSTVRLEMSLLSSVFDVGRIEWGICGANPVANVRKPKPPPGRDRRLTAREDRLILRYSHSHKNADLYSIIVLALETGMRQGEILKLRWEHINLKIRVAHLPNTKNGEKRDVPLSIKARDALIKLGVQPKGKVFRYTSEGIKSTWRFMMIKLGIENLHFHDLRHEAISRLFELGTMDLMEIASISGHKSLSMLKRYTHLRASRLVRKLEGQKSKGKQAIIDHLVPYPALIEDYGFEGIRIRILDFDDLIVSGPCRDSALKIAQDALLRKVMVMMRESLPLPMPDQYLDKVEEENVLMIDPLGVVSPF